jgi:hypothetical protein
MTLRPSHDQAPAALALLMKERTQIQRHTSRRIRFRGSASGARGRAVLFPRSAVKHPTGVVGYPRPAPGYPSVGLGRSRRAAGGPGPGGGRECQRRVRPGRIPEPPGKFPGSLTAPGKDESPVSRKKPPTRSATSDAVLSPRRLVPVRGFGILSGMANPKQAPGSPRMGPEPLVR